MSVEEILQSFNELSDDEQDSLLELLRKQRVKTKEAQILANLKELKNAIATGEAKMGTVEDLIADLNED